MKRISAETRVGNIKFWSRSLFRPKQLNRRIPNLLLSVAFFGIVKLKYIIDYLISKTRALRILPSYGLI